MTRGYQQTISYREGLVVSVLNNIKKKQKKLTVGLLYTEMKKKKKIIMR